MNPAQKTSLTVLVCLTLALCPALEDRTHAKENAFQVVGQFAVRRIQQGRYQVTDGRGRTLLLIPRGQKAPQGMAAHEVVRIPVRRLAAITGQDVALINALGEIETVVAVSGNAEKWRIPHIQEGLVTGKVISAGSGMNLDFEKVLQSRPELILTWDESIIPLAMDLGIPVLITHTERARNLEAQLKFAHVLAPLFNRFQEASDFEQRVRERIKAIGEKVSGAARRPKVIWGEVYPKRIMVEPGNSFHAEMVTLAGGNYLFKDLYGAS